MDIKKLLHNFIFAGSAYYTAISTGFLVVAQNLNEGGAVKLLETTQFLKILLLSFFMGLGYAIYRTDYFSKPVARCLHAGSYLLGFLLFAVLAGVDFTGAVVGTLIFAVVYVMCTFVRAMVLTALKGDKSQNKRKIEKVPTKAKKDQPYQSQFGTKQ